MSTSTAEFRTLDRSDRLPDNYASPYELKDLKHRMARARPSALKNHAAHSASADPGARAVGANHCPPSAHSARPIQTLEDHIENVTRILIDGLRTGR
jgi:hypothetical protein